MNDAAASAFSTLRNLPPTRWLIAVLHRLGLRGRNAVIALPYIWLMLFFVIPFVIVLKISFAEMQTSSPPYTSLIHWVGDKITDLRVHLNPSNYLGIWADGIYIEAMLTSLKVAAVSTVFALLIGYPMAYAIARSDKRWRGIFLMMVILPFWTSFLLRVYAWIGILKTNGLLNNFLLWLGVINEPFVMLQTDFAVYLGIVYSYLPFMIMPLYATLEKMDLTLLEAAEDLGCKPVRAFFAITLPLSMPGIIAGSMLVFIPAVGEYVIPTLLGPADSLMIGKLLWTDFFAQRDWPKASAVAIALLLVLIVPLVWFQRRQAQATEADRK